MRIALALIFYVTLTAVAAAQGSIASSATGLSGIYTQQVRLTDHPHHLLFGHVIIVERGDDTVRALVIQHRRDGVHRLRFTDAWSQGIALPFRSQARNRFACSHGHCRDAGVGMILLSRAAFAHVQTQGLQARLTGPSGSIDIAAPAELFQGADRQTRAFAP